jgi:putative SOS response-associated peptidase YedK
MCGRYRCTTAEKELTKRLSEDERKNLPNLTCEANELTDAIHNQMPLILCEEIHPATTIRISSTLFDKLCKMPS